MIFSISSQFSEQWAAIGTILFVPYEKYSALLGSNDTAGIARNVQKIVWGVGYNN